MGMQITIHPKMDNHYGHLTMVVMKGSVPQIQDYVSRIQVWCEENARGEWVWQARETIEHAIRTGHDAQSRANAVAGFANPVVTMTGLPFMIDFKVLEDAVLFKMFFEGE